MSNILEKLVTLSIIIKFSIQIQNNSREEKCLKMQRKKVVSNTEKLQRSLCLQFNTEYISINVFQSKYFRHRNNFDEVKCQ